MTGKPLEVRTALESEIDVLGRIWFDVWHETHAHLVPPELVRLRTLQSFRERLRAAHANLRTVGPTGNPVGFCVVRDSELYQLFVAAPARGTGAAAALIADAERRLAQSGVETAWLSCAIGNERAMRFYEKCGWHQAGRFVDHVETSRGPFALQVLRYEKCLR